MARKGTSMRKKQCDPTPLPKRLYVYQQDTSGWMIQPASPPAFLGYENANSIDGGTENVGEYVLVGKGSAETFFVPGKD